MAAVVEAGQGSVSPIDALAMRADFALWLCAGRASLLKRAGDEATAAATEPAAGKSDRTRITSMDQLAAFLRRKEMSR